MVQLKVINGGKLNGDARHANVRLFSAYSLVDNYQGRDGVRLNWIFLGREKPVAPFDRLIGDYKCIDERVKPYFEDYIRELFTEEEIGTLEGYLLETHGADLHINEESMPVTGIFVPMPFRAMPAGGGRGFYYPFEDEGYDLPFEVAAYFDLRNCPVSIALQYESKGIGLTYLRNALQHLGLSDHVKREQLELTVEALYDDDGLYVELGKTKEERLKEREAFMKCGVDSPPVRD